MKGRFLVFLAMSGKIKKEKILCEKKILEPYKNLYRIYGGALTPDIICLINDVLLEKKKIIVKILDFNDEFTKHHFIVKHQTEV